MDSSTDFSNLALTPSDYVAEAGTKYPAYKILRDGLYEQLIESFNELVAGKFPEEDWTVSYDYGIWDTNRTEPLVVVTPKLSPGTSYMMNYFVPQRSSNNNMDDTVTTIARIIRYSKGKYNGVLMDDRISGKGNYDPELWAQEAFDATHTYVFHGVLPSGW